MTTIQTGAAQRARGSRELETAKGKSVAKVFNSEESPEEPDEKNDDADSEYNVQHGIMFLICAVNGGRSGRRVGVPDIADGLQKSSWAIKKMASRFSSARMQKP